MLLASSESFRLSAAGGSPGPYTGSVPILQLGLSWLFAEWLFSQPISPSSHGKYVVLKYFAPLYSSVILAWWKLLAWLTWRLYMCSLDCSWPHLVGIIPQVHEFKPHYVILQSLNFDCFWGNGIWAHIPWTLNMVGICICTRDACYDRVIIPVGFLSQWFVCLSLEVCLSVSLHHSCVSLLEKLFCLFSRSLHNTRSFSALDICAIQRALSYTG